MNEPSRSPTVVASRGRSPAPSMGAGRGGGDSAEGCSARDNAIADSPSPASIDTAAALTPSHSLPRRGGGYRPYFVLRADEVIE
jgi:hypothetical protein